MPGFLPGFLIVALFALGGTYAVAVLVDSGLRGARAYRELSARLRSGQQGDSLIFTINQFARLQAEPAFRMRPVTRATGPHPMVCRNPAALPVAA